MEKNRALVPAVLMGALLTYGGVQNCNDRKAREALYPLEPKVEMTPTPAPEKPAAKPVPAIVKITEDAKEAVRATLPTLSVDLEDGNCHLNKEVMDYLNALKTSNPSEYARLSGVQVTACAETSDAAEVERTSNVIDMGKIHASVKAGLEGKGYLFKGSSDTFTLLIFTLPEAGRADYGSDGANRLADAIGLSDQMISLRYPEIDAEGFPTFRATYNGKDYAATTPEELTEKLIIAVDAAQ